jgi:L-ornithine N5-oxygenase
MQKDVVGVGFGPSNVAAAIAFREMAPHLETIFFEKRSSFAWHPGMMFDDALMQVSFLKDMASFRNPRSRFTFINYLHEKQRLADFVNLSTFYPTRVEFADYLAWCAAEFVDLVRYGLEVTSIEALHGPGGRVDRLRIAASGPSGPVAVETTSVLHAGGLEPVMPEGVRAGSRIFHSHDIIGTINRIRPKPGAHYIVAGCGQSAAEIIAFLHSRDPHARITSVFSRFGFMAADNSPFVNQIFDPQSVDMLYAMPQSDRDCVLQAHRATNYAAVDVDLIRTLYRSVYSDRLRGWERIHVKRLSYVLSAAESAGEVTVDVRSGVTGATEQVTADYLICATGFRPRSILPLLSEELRSAVLRRCDGQPFFGRAYDLQFEPQVTAKVYSVGMCEPTHGLSATLLSNMAVRAGEVMADICASRLATHPQRSTREDTQFVRL